MSHTVTVVGGAGTIGTTAAYTLASTRPEVTIRLCDVEREAAAGHATDLRHARCHATHALGAAGSARADPTADVTAVDPGPGALRDTDCVLVTASVRRPSGSTDRGGRDRFWPANRDVADDIAAWLADADPVPVVAVTNPVDRFLGRLHAESGWSRERFVGYSLSETARMADAVARHVDADPADVHCPILGEHGEHMVPAFSRATVEGEPLELSAGAREELLDYTKSVPYEIIAQRGAEHSSRWVSGRGAALIVASILDGGTDEPVPLSTPLDGEYGVKGVSLSVPVTLTEEGVGEIREWELSAEEREGLEAAAEAVREKA
jgi:malate dehydrogenase